jgi:hypothetical protein
MAMVKQTPQARVACRLEAKTKTPTTVRGIDGDDSWAAAAVAEWRAKVFS